MNAINPQAEFAVRIEKPVPGFYDEYECAYEVTVDENGVEDRRERYDLRRWRGPVYPKLPQLDKHRRLANSAGGTTAEQDREYGRAVHEAFRSLNGIVKHPRLNLSCSAWTPAKQRAQHLAQLHAGAEADRREGKYLFRTDDRETFEVAQMREYQAQMTAKRQRIALAAKRGASIVQTKAPLAPQAHEDRPVTISNDLPDCARALQWRKAQGLSRTALAERIGFSPSQIQDYEEGARRGKTGAAAEIGAAAWLRYRLACAAMAAGVAPAF